MAKTVQFVSQKGTKLTGKEKQAIMDRFSSSIPLAEKKLFVSMAESLSLQGLRPSDYFCYTLKCVDGHPRWNDVSAARHSETQFNNEGARTAIANVAIIHLETTPLFDKSPAIDLDLMIAVHSSAKTENAAFSVRYGFSGNELTYCGALFVSGGALFDEAVVKASAAFRRGNRDEAVFKSTVSEKC